MSKEGKHRNGDTEAALLAAEVEARARLGRAREILNQISPAFRLAQAEVELAMLRVQNIECRLKTVRQNYE